MMLSVFIMIKKQRNSVQHVCTRLVQQIIIRITAIAKTIFSQRNFLVHDTIMATRIQLIELPHGRSHDLSHDLQFLWLATLYNAI